jgi:aromatic-L-amino-acid/L-tryptophan decarboxylase
MTTVAPLALDAPREEVLERALHLISDAWRSFDHYRSEEPPLDERVRALLDARLPEEPTAAFEALDDVARILDESIAQPRPRYFAFIGSSGLPIGVVGDALASCYDVNLARYAAAATEVERQAVRWVAEFVGFPSDAGSFTSGGTVSNLTALAAARERALPGCRLEGPAGRRAAIYGSDEVHYSVRRAVEILGLGAKSLRIVPMDADHRLRPEALAEALDRDLAAGVTPVAVVASAGTTLTGAVDPTDAIADVCAARDVWLHVDGAYGLPAAGTRAYGALFAGVERADSIALDAHKWLYLPKACSVVLARDAAALAATFAHEESYMPHAEGELHAADITLEYSRPFRALKLWLAFRVHGAQALREAIERNIAQARLLADEVRRQPDLELALEPQLSIVPFRHLPGEGTDLDAHNLRLAEALQADGRVYLASAIIDERAWLRPCIVNYRTTDEDVLALVEIVREVGARLAGLRNPAWEVP